MLRRIFDVNYSEIIISYYIHLYCHREADLAALEMSERHRQRVLPSLLGVSLFRRTQNFLVWQNWIFPSKFLPLKTTSMLRVLSVAEKPSVAKEIAQILSNGSYRTVLYQKNLNQTVNFWCIFRLKVNQNTIICSNSITTFLAKTAKWWLRPWLAIWWKSTFYPNIDIGTAVLQHSCLMSPLKKPWERWVNYPVIKVTLLHRMWNLLKGPYKKKQKNASGSCCG